jgi:molecular chaperone DnaK (HSP70)
VIKTVGVDFGTSTTLVSERHGKDPENAIVLGRTGLDWMPSVVAVTPRGELVVGERAEAMGPTTQIRSIKTSITRNDEMVVLSNTSGGSVEVAVDQVLHAVLVEARRRATEQDLGLLDGARLQLGCPVLWRRHQRKRLADIATQAGFPVQVADLVDEPVAAGISWFEHRSLVGQEPPQGTVVVFDPGGGTLDVAVLRIVREETPELTVLASAGLAEAGDALDATLANALREQVGPDAGDVDPAELEGFLLRAARDLKERLSTSETASALLGDTGILLTMDRERLEELFEPQLCRQMRLAQSAMKAAKLRERKAPDPSTIRKMPWQQLACDVDYVLLSGGMSQIPIVKKRLRELFPQAQVEVDPLLRYAQAAVVSGLSYSESFERLNLPRPALNFAVTFSTVDGVATDPQILYPAFEPLIEPARIVLGDFDNAFRVEFQCPDLPGRVKAELVCRAADGVGTPISFREGSNTFKGIGMETRSGEVGVFKLYVDGRISVRAGKNEWPREFRVERWPVLRGSGYSFELEIRKLDSRHENQRHDDNWWQYK